MRSGTMVEFEWVDVFEKRQSQYFHLINSLTLLPTPYPYSLPTTPYPLLPTCPTRRAHPSQISSGEP